VGVTAGSPLQQRERLLRGDHSTAAEASLENDLLGCVRVVACTAPRNTTLDAVARIFGTRIEGEGIRAEVERCQERADQLVTAGRDISTAVAIGYASDLFVLCTIERRWRRGEAERIVSKLALLLELSSDSLALQLFLGAVRAPQLHDLPPAVALETQVRLLLGLAPVSEISLWTKGSDARPICLAEEGSTTQTRRFRGVAMRALEGVPAQSGSRGTILGVPVSRWETPWAALVARTRVERRETVRVYLAEAAAAMSPVIERELVLERSAARERSLVRASERRLGRLAFDLHDGALQHIAAFGADLYLVRRQVQELLPEEHQAIGTGRLNDLDARIWELDRVLRELAHSLEPGSLVRRPLPVVINDEVASFTERTGIHVQQRITGDFSGMTVSQKIALIRVVQEALTNIREHANASRVRITITARTGRVEARVEDDGVGFHVARTLLDGAQRGRLGLVGSSERIRLLGGRFDVKSRPGGPTTVSLSVPRWRPLGVENVDGDAEVAIPALVAD
jgi:signal transduction histidine kinase